MPGPALIACNVKTTFFLRNNAVQSVLIVLSLIKGGPGPERLNHLPQISPWGLPGRTVLSLGVLDLGTL